jgi:hypothetical protein
MNQTEATADAYDPAMDTPSTLERQSQEFVRRMLTQVFDQEPTDAEVAQVAKRVASVIRSIA